MPLVSCLTVSCDIYPHGHWSSETEQAWMNTQYRLIFFIESSIMAVEVTVMNDITLMVEWTLHIHNHGLLKE